MFVRKEMTKMKFDYFKKTKIVLAIVMTVITLAYVVSMTGSFIKYEYEDYQTDKDGVLIKDENGDYISETREVDFSQLKYLWFPNSVGAGGNTDMNFASSLESELKDYYGDSFVYTTNKAATAPVLLFVLGIVVAILAITSFFGKNKILWTVFAVIWGIIGVYCYLTNPLIRAAGHVEMLMVAKNLVTVQTIIVCAGCAVAIAAFVISYYAKKKNHKMLMESILKRD